MDNYGVDKPDLRFENKIQDWTEHFSDSAATSFIEKVPHDTYSVKAVVFQKGIEYIASATELRRLEKEVLEEGSLFKCTLCGKTGAQKNNVVNHVENIHFPGTFQYICPVCHRPMITKKALDNHIHRNHKENQTLATHAF